MAPPAPAPVASPAPPASPEPPPPPRDPWAALLAELPEFARVTVQDTAGFQGAADGVVTLVVRSDFGRTRVYDALKSVDIGRWFPGFRRLELKVDAAEGRTGREARAEAEVKRREDARRAAETAPAVLRLMAAFQGRLERVEPAGGVARDMGAGIEEDRDE